jgi:hypothetical protein
MMVAWGFGLCARAVRRLVRLPALLCCEAVTFVAFPVRMLSAVDRERKVTDIFFFFQLFFPSFF